MLPLTFGKAPDAPLKILCVGAHSDDVEIGCGGTLLRLLQERPGSSVHWVVFSASPERQTEARNSAAAFTRKAGSMSLVLNEFRESYFPAQWSEIKDAFEATRRQFEPELVFCHRREDMHQDHRVIADFSWNTFRNHVTLEYEIPKYEGDLGTPNLFVPLPRAIADEKVALLLEHFPSQAKRTWFKSDTFHGIMSVRGIECNAPEGRAEAFYAKKFVV